MTPIHPTARYAIAETQRGAWIQRSSTMTPSVAPTHADTSTTARSAPWNSSSVNAVYVPAMKTKIIAWSSRRARSRAAVLRHGKR